jgi:hypothetical protein
MEIVMKIAVYVSAAIVALSMSIGAANAEDRTSEIAKAPGFDSANTTINQFDQLKGVTGVVKMPAEELSEIVAGNIGCNTRRRWFDRGIIQGPQQFICVE